MMFLSVSNEMYLHQEVIVVYIEILRRLLRMKNIFKTDKKHSSFSWENFLG